MPGLRQPSSIPVRRHSRNALRAREMRCRAAAGSIPSRIATSSVERPSITVSSKGSRSVSGSEWRAASAPVEEHPDLHGGLHARPLARDAFLQDGPPAAAHRCRARSNGDVPGDDIEPGAPCARVLLGLQGARPSATPAGAQSGPRPPRRRQGPPARCCAAEAGRGSVSISAESTACESPWRHRAFVRFPSSRSSRAALADEETRALPGLE